MKKINILEEIIKGEPLSGSRELISWIQESKENQGEYIRYKNLWALLQRGKEMEPKYVSKDYKLVKHRIDKTKNKIRLNNFIKYAAIIIVAIAFGFYINTIGLQHRKNEISINEITVPNGNRSQVVLPDGSQVWLSNGSKLIYPETFTGKSRNVKLEGEAYFTVSHNLKKPFFVDLGGQRIKVLGTEFSVQAYPDDNIVQVDLITGKVQLDIFDENNSEGYKSYMLKPLHSLVLDKTSGILKDIEIPDNFFKYWKEGIYEFENESFENLAKKIERIYNVELIFEDVTLCERLFTGTFKVTDNIFTVMEAFKRASQEPFDFIIERDKIYLKLKN